MAIEKVVEHHWKPMEEFIINDSTEDFLSWIEGNIKDKIEILKKLKPNQYIRWSSGIDVVNLNSVLDVLIENGLNIGKGSCEYGYRMPILQDRSKERELIIFKRY